MPVKRTQYVVAFALLSGFVFAVCVAFMIGSRAGAAKEAAGSISVGWLQLPLEVTQQISLGNTNVAQMILERQIDTGILSAIRMRHRLLLEQDAKRNLDGVLRDALLYRQRVDYVYVKPESLPPATRRRYEKAESDLLATGETMSLRSSTHVVKGRD